MTTTNEPPDAARLAALADAVEPRPNGLASNFTGAGITEVFLIRHAQMPVSDGGDDFALTDIGREQAEVLGAHLARLRFDAIYASPAQRTQQTAAPLARRLGLKIEVIDDLEDVRHFLPPGKKLRDLLSEAERAEIDRRMLVERRWDVRGRYSEASAVLRARAVAAIEPLFARWSGGRIAVFSHGPLINAYVAEIIHSPYDAFFHASLASVSVIVGKGEHRFIEKLNSTTHFGG